MYIEHRTITSCKNADRPEHISLVERACLYIGKCKCKCKSMLLSCFPNTFCRRLLSHSLCSPNSSSCPKVILVKPSLLICTAPPVTRTSCFQWRGRMAERLKSSIIGRQAWKKRGANTAVLWDMYQQQPPIAAKNMLGYLSARGHYLFREANSFPRA